MTFKPMTRTEQRRIILTRKLFDLHTILRGATDDVSQAGIRAQIRLIEQELDEIHKAVVKGQISDMAIDPTHLHFIDGAEAVYDDNDN